MMRLTGGATVVAVGVMLAPVAAQAQTPGLVNAQVEISAAVAGSSATLEAIERQANALDRARQAEIAALQTRLTEAEARGAAEVARLQAELIAAREALVADLAARDRAYADEIAVFRREVTAIASTLEGAAALARYNAGDRVGAIAVLDRLIRARDAARQTRAAIEGAAERRQVATLALDARAKSDPAFDTGAVIVRFEEVVRLDPGESKDWDELAQLYSAAGRRENALAAAERMEALATNDRDRSTALVYKADLLLSQGDRDGALGLYRRGLEIRERLSAADPGSADLASSVSVALIKIGDLLYSQGDRDGALRSYRRSLETLERLSAADPTSADRARDLSVSLSKIGFLLESQGDRDGALGFFRRGLEISERLSAADPASVDLARDVLVSNGLMARVTGERRYWERALAIFRDLEARGALAEADRPFIAQIEETLAELDAGTSP
jgi:tetratricopeptide (TPR) repeat protein